MKVRVRAIVLVAGAARRLHPLTLERPKCLLPVAGRTILSRAVSILADRGITRFTVVDGFACDQVRAALTSEFPPGWFTFVHNPDFASTNNAYSLWLARLPDEDPIVLLDGDLVFDPEVLDLLLEDRHPNRLAVRTRGDVGEEDVKVVLGPDGRISDIGKNVSFGRTRGESVGIAAFSAPFAGRLFEVLECRISRGAGRDEFYESAFLELIEAGEAVYPVDLEELRAIEVDTAEDLERARSLFV
ncbi:MAG TPA: phosphocholine cytidylyltransferase family protein [Thermoanaerobaculia bacterium]|nr:phosphocholine cytidylyltransferase family protein [Thermoanaerobaculia bacterium]